MHSLEVLQAAPAPPLLALTFVLLPGSPRSPCPSGPSSGVLAALQGHVGDGPQGVSLEKDTLSTQEAPLQPLSCA